MATTPDIIASLFGLRFDLLTAEELRTWVRAVVAGPEEARHIAFSNPDFVLQARRNGRLHRYLNGCDLNLVVRVGVVRHRRRPRFGAIRRPGGTARATGQAVAIETEPPREDRVIAPLAPAPPYDPIPDPAATRS